MKISGKHFRKQHGRVRGFSLIEMVIVVAVALSLAAVALPSFLNSISSYRLSNVAASLASLIDLNRFVAVQSNNLITLRQTTQSGNAFFYIDKNNNSVMDASEQRLLLPSDMLIMQPGSGVPGPSATGFQYPTATVFVSATSTLTFDARGSVNSCAGAASVCMIILGDPSRPQSGYRAITLNPMGQIKTWTWSAQTGGGSWVAY
jgi:prepilin-type N-terminal cleavage/methylation domain-containing protein